ncbi:VacJ family lipoprotein [uncultured Desulfuromonas sp.]|uniref:MlaA family lipoprotein n=1 Tax=uncultured Desulfuromonas sp. TaxID=181013 RepID=UPI002AABF202|nr:VacJ family lipoprotein [uncultured Desulfuromonas sp.]
MKRVVAIFLFMMLCLSAVATSAVAAEEQPAPPLDLYGDLYGDELSEPPTGDPLEVVNRGVFWFNDKMYFYLLKPVARGFRVVPEPARVGLGNMLDNVKSPIRAANALLQLKFKDCGTELGRLVVNTTLGIFGFYDAADIIWSIKKKDEDFGQTLGYYGVEEGFYLVLPFLGSSTLRDSLSLFPDRYADPVFWAVRQEAAWGITGANVVNRLSLDKDTYESIVEEQLDPYLFVRDAYLQNRAADVKE